MSTLNTRMNVNYFQMLFINSNIYGLEWRFGGCRGRDRIVLGLTTNYAISAYHY